MTIYNFKLHFLMTSDIDCISTFLFTIHILFEGYEYSSVVGNLPKMQEAVGSFTSTKNTYITVVKNLLNIFLMF